MTHNYSFNPTACMGRAVQVRRAAYRRRSGGRGFLGKSVSSVRGGLTDPGWVDFTSRKERRAVLAWERHGNAEGRA